MSRELYFQTGVDVIKYQDSTNHLDLSLTDDGKPFDISQADSMTLRIGNSNGYLMSKNIDISNVSDPQSGNISIHLDEDTMTKLVPDDYNIEVWVDVNPISIVPESNDVIVTVSDKGLDASQAIFPSDGNLSFTVDDNIKSSPFDTINAYPIDDIWNSVQQWKTDAANSISTNLSSQLLNEITHWQGDISDSLKKDLLQALMNDESTIQKQLNDILTQSLDELINKEVSDAKSDISKQLNDAMIADVSQQIANLKPQVTSDLHSQLTSELSTELSSAIQQWENSTDNDLNNKLAQAIVQKTNDMQGTLSTQLTNYLAGQLSNYEQNATNTITTNITNQVTQSISNLFSQEDSSLRADLEGLVKGTIQNDVTNTLQQMQQNGDIYATKQQFTDFKNGVNDLIAKLNIASDITRQLSTINNTLTEIPTIKNNITTLQGSVSSNASSIASLTSSFSSNSTSASSAISSNATNIAGNSSAINSLASSASSAISSNATNIDNNSSAINRLNNTSFQYSRDLQDGDDLNNITQSGIYGCSNKNVANAPIGGLIFFQLIVTWGAGFATQMYITSWGDTYQRTFSGSPLSWSGWEKQSTSTDLNTAINQTRNDLTNNINGRVDWNTYNNRTNDLQNQVWNRVSNDTFNNRTNDLQNQINNKPNSWDSLSFKGEPYNSNLSEVQQTGVYVLNGRYYGDYPSKAHTVWGHMIVIGIWGMTTQFIVSNRGRVLSRMISSLGTSEWSQLN